jgi:hypothetical protein
LSTVAGVPVIHRDQIRQTIHHHSNNALSLEVVPGAFI